jgi:MscS family membrane protein
MTRLSLNGARVLAGTLFASGILFAAHGAAEDTNLLAPPDRSSPRDTIEGFMVDMEPVVERIRNGRLELSKKDGSLNRALSALDYSTTPHGNTWVVRIERALMLLDVLDRIGLPPPEELPGDTEVERDSIELWAVPGSPIRLRRTARVDRQDEFLFAPETVERLDRYHRRTEGLPSGSGEPSLLRAFFEDPSAEFSQTRSKLFRSRLKRIDTTSPRATLEGFLDSVNRAFAIANQAEAALQADPPTMTHEEALEADRLAKNYMARALSTLDLSEVPEAYRQDVGLETALQLKEVLDRNLLPPFESIPGEIRVRSRGPNAKPLIWRYPNTEIEIVQIPEGENQGRFLFKAKTVRLIPTYYERVKEFPYRSPWKHVDVDYLSPAVSPGFYEDYIGTPGFFVPSASLLSSLVDALPEEMDRTYEDQTVWQWLALFMAVLLAAGAVLWLFILAHRWARRLEESARSWVLVVPPAVGVLVFLQTLEFLDKQLNITGTVLMTTRAVGLAIATGLGIWAVLRVSVAITESIIASPRTPDTGLNATLIRIAGRLAGFFAGLWIAIAVIQDHGVDLIPVIAGLGVGGLAVALAAQRTFANVLGGLILYLNKPVRLGEFCLYGDEKMGVVEDIGLLSTRIRTLEGNIVTIPNADFSEYEIEVRDRRLFTTVIGLRYETSPRQLRYVVATLRELLDDHPRVEPGPRVRFVGLGEYSLDVQVFAHLNSEDHSTYLAIREDLLMQIMTLVEDAGSDFAFPSATEYQAEEQKMDPERGKEVEAQVESWWAEGKLARPGFEDSPPGEGDATTGYIEDEDSGSAASK